jgi:formylglycine-generating enzyme required for sulfatase activity
MEFVPIAPGTFEMGSKFGRLGELKLHKVTLTRGFEMGKYEVTQAEWESIMGSNPSVFGKHCGKNCPVENVTWEEVQEFISKLNEIKDGYIYRLPTEAEWEYACRAGLKGDFEGDLEEMGWFMTNSGGTTHEVGKKKANDWGLYDMYGNVFELVSDWDSNEAIDGVKDPTGPKTGKYHVMRGGSWGINTYTSWVSIDGTSGERKIGPSYRKTAWGPRHPHVGFRLVRMPLQ